MPFKAGDPRRTAQWRRLRTLVLARRPLICHRCGKPIDTTLRHPHPMSAQVDHLIPIEERPDLAYTLTNLAPIHRTENISKENERRRTGSLNPGRAWV